MKVELKGKKATNDISTFEEKQYGDIWTNDEYLQFMYERIVIMKELLSDIRDYLGHDYEEMTQQYVDFMPKKISAANQEFFKKGENSLASGIKKCKRGK